MAPGSYPRPGKSDSYHCDVTLSAPVLRASRRTSARRLGRSSSLELCLVASSCRQGRRHHGAADSVHHTTHNAEQAARRWVYSVTLTARRCATNIVRGSNLSDTERSFPERHSGPKEPHWTQRCCCRPTLARYRSATAGPAGPAAGQTDKETMAGRQAQPHRAYRASYRVRRNTQGGNTVQGRRSGT